MPTTFSGVWQAGTGDHFLWVDASWDNFKAQYDQLATQGLRLIALDTYTQGGQRLWAGAWRAGSGDHFLWVDASWDNFKAQYDRLATQGLRLVAFRSYEEMNQRFWAGAWQAGTGDHYLWVDASWDNFKAQYDQLATQGLRLIALDTYTEGGQRLWAGAWRAGTGDHYLWADASWDNFRAQYEQLASQGLRLLALRSYIDEGQQFWAGAWGPGSGDYFVWVGASWDYFKAQYDRLASQGLRLVALDVSAVPAVVGRTVILHPKILANPVPDLETMVASMRLVYGAVDLDVDVRATQQITDPTLVDLPVGSCMKGAPTPEQVRLFAHREGVGPNEIVAYFVRSTIPPYNGCAVFPPGEPGAVIAQNSTQWTLAHEMGHVLGLEHVDDNHHLMTGNGTSNITNPPPILDPSEVATMLASPFIH